MHALYFLKVIELRYIQSREEQLEILQACHADPTSGHLGIKKTVNKTTEHFYVARNCEGCEGDGMFYYLIFMLCCRI